VLLALEASHGIGIIHHNLHPEGIIIEETIGEGDSVKVLDIGLWKLISSASGERGHEFEYISPEQLIGSSRDRRSDLYTCGVILFQLLTGRLPFQARSPSESILMHVTKPPPNPAMIAPEREIPQGLVDITLKALEEAPRERFQTAEEFADALRLYT
jgi:serine/threonine-protein kinase